MPPPNVNSVDAFERVVKEMAPFDRTYKRLYRGQPEPWPLLPSLFRNNPPSAVEKVEKELLNRFKHEVPSFMRSRPKNEWDWLSLGQHFRLRTRLLDWSQNSLIGLYFAVQGTPKAPVVYVYHVMKSQIVSAQEKSVRSPFDISQVRVLEPSLHSPRVELQQGWHTVDKIRQGKTGKEMFVALERMEWHNNRIKSIAIDAASAFSIRHELARKRGIKRSTVYGDFQDVCEEIRKALGVR
jgi:hypothetical protein